MKECFGTYADSDIRFISRSQVNFLAINEDKKKNQCWPCEEMLMCVPETYETLLKELLKMLDSQRNKSIGSI